MDPEYRTESRRRWGRSAAGWRRRADQLRDATMPVTTWMVDAVAPQPGEVLLELAAGVGDVGFLAAEDLAPSGTLICSDFVPEMLTVAQQRARELGVDNVRFRQIDAESIDQPAASLDGVLCRWGYMLMADPGAALRETRRVLKSGGRLSLAAWASPDANPWSSLPQRELHRRRLSDPPVPGAPGQFAWAADGAVAEALQDAGFVDFHVDTVNFSMRYVDFEHWWETQLDLSRALSDVAATAAREQVEEVREALRAAAASHRTPEGTLALPARTWVAAAVA